MSSLVCSSERLTAAQFRMHKTTATDVYLHTGSMPVIEHCKGIRFAAYPFEELVRVSAVCSRSSSPVKLVADEQDLASRTVNTSPSRTLTGFFQPRRLTGRVSIPVTKLLSPVSRSD